MTDLIPMTALGATEPRRETHGALTLVENADLALASLTLRRGQSAPSPFGLTLPPAGQAVAGANAGAFWIGRDQWMIEGPGQGASDFCARVLAEAPACSVSEQTDGFTAFEITSSGGAGFVEPLLAKLVNLDPKGFTPGSVVRTNLEHMSVFLLRRSDDHLAVIGMRTYAQALWHALATAARGWGGR